MRLLSYLRMYRRYIGRYLDPAYQGQSRARKRHHNMQNRNTSRDRCSEEQLLYCKRWAMKIAWRSQAPKCAPRSVWCPWDDLSCRSWPWCCWQVCDDTQRWFPEMEEKTRQYYWGQSETSSEEGDIKSESLRREAEREHGQWGCSDI